MGEKTFYVKEKVMLASATFFQFLFVTFNEANQNFELTEYHSKWWNQHHLLSYETWKPVTATFYP